MNKKFRLIAAGGTFDHLHRGHKFFLKRAFSLSERVIIGLTSDEFVKKKVLSFKILPFETRRNHLLEFLKKNGLFQRATVIKLDDIYGPAIDKDSLIEGILVTKKTLSGAQAINEKRQNLNLPPLEIIKVATVKENQRTPVSSVNSRIGLLTKKTLILPNKLRPFLKQPLGKFIQGKKDNLKIAAQMAKKLIQKNNSYPIITVGDVVTQSFNQVEISISLAIVDFKVKREQAFKNLRELGFRKEQPDLEVENPPGTISHSLSAGIKKTIEKIISQPITHNPEPITIKVLGEEDLAVLPAIILTPQNSAIFYGQPGQGIVYIEVGESIKNRVLKLLSQFKT